MSRFPVRNSAWDDEHSRWLSQAVELPLNPYATAMAGRPIGIILTPKEFLRTFPSVDPMEFWEFAMSTDGDVIRNDLNFEIGQKVDHKRIVSLARRRPALLRMYLDSLENQPKDPYDVNEDPEFRVRRYDDARSINASLPTLDAPNDNETLGSFVRAIVDNYKNCVESSRGWTLLWASGNPRPETQAQALFWTSAKLPCEAADVDLTPEGETGRGPVDFKLSRGASAKVLVELKYAKSSSFWRNIENQLPTYQRAEGCDRGFLVVIQFTEKDCTEEFVSRATALAADVATKSKLDYQVIFVDARPKESASLVSNLLAED